MTSSPPPSGRPLPGEYASYAQDDIDAVAGDDAVAALEAQLALVLTRLGPLSEDRVRGLTYAPGKWTLKEVVGHLADDERIFMYRALCVARGDQQPMPGFDENAYMDHAGFEDRPLADLLEEYRSVRRASISLFRAYPGMPGPASAPSTATPPRPAAWPSTSPAMSCITCGCWRRGT